jgi:hypothetical protein
MESWRKVWRDGIAPLLSDQALSALAIALETDDPRLVQGATTVPAPLPSVHSWSVETACLLGYCAWQGDGLGTVGEVEDYFGCTVAHCGLQRPAARCLGPARCELVTGSPLIQ